MELVSRRTEELPFSHTILTKACDNVRVMEKIVIIEDDPGIRTVLRLALKGAGYTSLYEADRGDEGLASPL